MKLIKIFVLSFPLFAMAQTSDLSAAFKREFSYLSAQTEVLSREETNSLGEFQKTKNQLKNEIIALEKQIVNFSAKNEELADKVARAERRKREINSKSDSLASLYKKASTFLDHTEKKLNFQATSEVSTSAPAQVRIKDFKNVAQKSLQLLEKSTRVEEVHSSYVNLSGELVNSTLVRFGRMGAQVVEGSVRKILGPSPESVLKEMEIAASVGPTQSIYFFKNLNDKINLKQSAGFWDKVADFLPLAVLIALFALVLGLFAVFAKE